MEKTKKQKKLIIIHLSVFFLVILVICSFFFFYLLPIIREVQGIKKSTYDTFVELSTIEKKGIGYSEFKSAISNYFTDSIESGEDSLYLAEIANNITEDFYNTYLVNNTSSNYLTFLKEQSIEEGEGKLIEEKNKIISNILPVYSEVISDLGEGSLSEFKLINYIESIMETFSLDFVSKIGVPEVVLLEDYSVGMLDSSLETNLYYIPITFELTGKRSNILDFLYFIGNVGKIYVEGEELYINTEISTDFRDTFRNKILKGESTDSKIFNNQIIDVESLYFTEYIDPDTVFSDRYKDNSLTKYIKTTAFSGDGNYKITITLRFYVKGLPIYKIEQYIKKFVQDFKLIQAKINMTISNANNVDKQKLDSINNAMGQLEKSILPLIQKSLSSKDTINEGYSMVNNYYPVINEYKATLEQIESNLSENKTIEVETLPQDTLE